VSSFVKIRHAGLSFSSTSSSCRVLCCWPISFDLTFHSASELKPSKVLLYLHYPYHQFSHCPVLRRNHSIYQYFGCHKVVTTIFAGSLSFVVINLITYFLSTILSDSVFDHYHDFLITCMVMVTFRMVVKVAFLELQRPERSNLDVIIYGRGSWNNCKKGSRPGCQYKIQTGCFVDDDPGKVGKA